MSVIVKTPWLASMGSIPPKLDYFDGSMYEMVEKIAEKYPNNIALDFMGRKVSYRRLTEEVERCAKALRAVGVRENDSVAIAMPNCPQAVYAFYAVNLIGAVANMIHPLSAEKEIEFYLNESESVTAVTLDRFYGKFEAVRKNTYLANVIVASVKDELSKPIKAGYMLTEGRKIQKIPKNAPIIRWKSFMKMSDRCFYEFRAIKKAEDSAVILYSGGTTGTTKGIVLSNMNFNALASQVISANPMFCAGDRMLAAMPLFHGFGLGVCIHAMLSHGGRCVLVPRFTAKSYEKLITKYKCNFIAGVPTLYEAILRLPDKKKADYSSLKGIFSGGDNLSEGLADRFNDFLARHKCTVKIREGYGTTETVNACCLMPPHIFKRGSIGIPLPDTYIKIVKPNTETELPYGEEGEIIISGPTVMKGYLNDAAETEKAVRTHADGRRWVYTGDLGSMDNDGFVYFHGRAKRMIVSSGYNIYPLQIENILNAHKSVNSSCVVGIPDAYRMHMVKAFVELKAGIAANEETKEEILEYCRKNIAKYAMPQEMEFIESLPKTSIGKIDYRRLEQEEAAKV